MKQISDITRLSLLEMQSAAKMYGRDCRVVRWAFLYRRLRNKIWWEYRRRVLSFLHAGPAKDEKLHVFWYLRGGIGDVAVARQVVLALRQKLPQAVFYYYTDSPSAASAVFIQDDKNVFLPTAEPLCYKYDVAFELCQSFRLVHVNEKRIRQIMPAFCAVLQEMQKRQKEFAFFLNDSYLMEDLLGRWMFHQGLSRLSLHRYLSGLDFDEQDPPALPDVLTGKEKLNKWGLADKKYITLHDGIDVTLPLKENRPLKCWSLDKWKELATLIKKQYPDILLVQLGGKNSPKFDFADVCLVGKTQISDLPSLLHHAALHIDGESGLVQLSRYLKNKSVVLFGPTDKHFFGIDKNINLKEDVCGSCMWLFGPQWHTQCALGYPACQNMKALTVQSVFQSVQENLK